VRFIDRKGNADSVADDGRNGQFNVSSLQIAL
jgi:hypothetical protein